MKSGIKTALIGESEVSFYYTEETFHEVFDILYHTNLPLFAVESKIPLRRLTYDYTSLTELNSEYLEKLGLVKDTIEPALEFLFGESFIRIEKTHDDKIREFLANAIN